ncbi:HD domain-containing protein [Ancylomarina salipaludis]|uniref:HD domain-containing protein n=1 Tax=Ancylomarina salipaludis TaxID=2501299 RepID=A0A4Q1JJ39_9BACT|nr:Pycsar system effector family protein [Ancylomarina salipaludis]RXQ90367.1 HD domain-containing protein [Ancylomarina salipaludis]
MSILDQAKAFVIDFFEKNHTPIYTYHNLEHTENVVKQASKIGSILNFSEEDLEILILAAWFHDTGYFNGFINHETTSSKIAEEFLKEKNYPSEKIERVSRAILNTKLPYKACECNISKALCDADLQHLSSKNFMKSSDKLREERSALIEHEISTKTYWEETLNFLKKHNYCTEYGKKVMAKKKELNIQKVTEKVNSYQNKEIQKLNEKVIKLENQNLKLKMPQRGIETMFKVTSRNQINLSSIADKKANLMISVNSIIISAIFFIFKNIMEVPHFIIPCLILLCVSLVTIIYSVLATRPNVTSGTFSQQDVKEKKVNLLFFGNFHRMHVDDYSKALKGLMVNYDDLYDSLIKDQYYLGVVLGKKYNLLRRAYTIFMFGLIISVLSFIFAAIYQPVFF